nr:MAG TPA: hypothetical protein [Caudoviricetes sp.]
MRLYLGKHTHLACMRCKNACKLTKRRFIDEVRIMEQMNEREYLIRRADCLSKAFLQADEYKCLSDEKRQDLAVFAVFVKNYLKKETREDESN